MTTFFGEPWPSGVCDDGVRVKTPVGIACLLCEEPIADTDQGSYLGIDPVHRECALRSVIGGWGHHVNHHYWCIQMHDPDGGLSYRESARRVWSMNAVGLLRWDYVAIITRSAWTRFTGP